MKKILIATSDKKVLDLLIPLFEGHRVFSYRILRNNIRLHRHLQDENDFFMAIVDTHLSEVGDIEAIKEVLSFNIPLIAMINNIEDQWLKPIKNLDIIDYIVKDNQDDIIKAVTLAEDLLRYNAKKTLVINNNKTLSLFLANFLKQILFEPIVVNDLKKGLELLRSGEEFKVLIVNYECEGMKGSEFVKLVREDERIKVTNKNIAIFGITSNNSEDVYNEFIKNGVDDVFRIPFSKSNALLKLSSVFKAYLQDEELNSHMNLIDKYVIFTQTDEFGTITNLSKAFEKISGYKKEQLLNKPHSSVAHPDAEKSKFFSLWKCIKSGKTWHGEFKNRSKDGQTFWLRANVSPDYKDGILVGYTAISEDITAQKELQILSEELETRVEDALEENRQQSERILAQSRLAQMGEMLSMIAHQWRQPLTSISAIIGNMLMEFLVNNSNEAKMIDRLKQMENITQHLSTTIKDFQGFFNEDKEQVITSWKKLAEESLLVIGPTLESEGIKLREDYCSNESIYIYPNEVKQVIIDIMKNAKDAFETKDINEPAITLKSVTEGSESTLFISDNAGGIPNEIINRVFEPYFTTKEEYNGSGLGLYMSKTIIEDHCGGKLRVSNQDEGARFSITFSVHKDDSYDSR